MHDGWKKDAQDVWALWRGGRKLGIVQRFGDDAWFWAKMEEPHWSGPLATMGAAQHALEAAAGEGVVEPPVAGI